MIHPQKFLRTILTNRYMTDRHSPFERYGLALASAAITLFVTFRPRLARETFRAMAEDRFVAGLR